MKGKKLLVLGAVICTLGTAIYARDIVTSSNSQSEWKGSVFGDVGGKASITPKNFKITEDEEGTVRISVSNNKGKIASNSDGLIYYYQDVNSSKDFHMTALMEINDYNSNNQVAFGLMVRDEILENDADEGFISDYVATGAIRLADPVAKHTFTRVDGKGKRAGDYSYNPSTGDEIRVNLEKNGNTYTTWVEDEEPVVTDVTFSGNNVYVGMYAVRNADITFRDIEFEVK